MMNLDGENLYKENRISEFPQNKKLKNFC